MRGEWRVAMSPERRKYGVIRDRVSRMDSSEEPEVYGQGFIFADIHTAQLIADELNRTEN